MKHVEATAVGQHQVEQHQLNGGFAQYLPRFAQGMRQLHLEAVTFERVSQRLQDGRFIVDEQKAGHQLLRRAVPMSFSMRKVRS